MEPSVKLTSRRYGFESQRQNDIPIIQMPTLINWSVNAELLIDQLVIALND